MRIAVCFTGHIRDYDLTNFKTNFSDIVTSQGDNIDYFISTWNTEGHRCKQWNTDTINITEIMNDLKPKSVLIQDFNRDYFIHKYQTREWINHSHLSDCTTLPDAVSMWYSNNSVYELVYKYQQVHNFTYDIIVKTRFDVLLDTPIDYNYIIDSIKSNCVYIPKWHGKWFEISHGITDYFGIGPYELMSEYLTVFDNIYTLLSLPNIPHTGEGLLYAQLLSNNINIKRLETTGFSIKRPLNVIEKII